MFITLVYSPHKLFQTNYHFSVVLNKIIFFQIFVYKIRIFKTFVRLSDYLFLLNVYECSSSMYVCMCINNIHVWCLWRSEESVRSLDLKLYIVANCHLDTKNKTWPSVRATSDLNSLTISPTQEIRIFLILKLIHRLFLFICALPLQEQQMGVEIT